MIRILASVIRLPPIRRLAPAVSFGYAMPANTESRAGRKRQSSAVKTGSAQ